MCNILLVEDSPTDATIMLTTFKGIGYSGEIEVMADGIEAINYLEQVILDQTADLPQLILLDLNLPRKSGYETLQEIKGNPQSQNIPVIVISSSSRSSDIANSYGLHANAYVAKPIMLEDYRVMVQRIHDFWLETAQRV